MRSSWVGHNEAVTDQPLVLGIETSCDETGVGLVRGHTLLADAVASSIDEHARFGGVVPEVASRAHLEAMVPTVERACETAGVNACPDPHWKRALICPFRPSGAIIDASNMCGRWKRGWNASPKAERDASA